MVNTRRITGNNSSHQNQDQNPNPNDNQINQMAQFMAMQTQLMQTMMQTLNNMQQQSQMPPPPPAHNSRLGEFLRTRPPTFSQAKDPLEANDWLKAIEKKLMIAQCTDRERVLFAAHQLLGPAADWWDAYCDAHANMDTITWQEFRDAFRAHFVPIGLIQLKKREFSDLKQ